MPLDFLNGTRVVESSAFIAAPLAGLTLAQFGAEVIRVDAIGGGIDYRRMPMAPDGRSLYWTGLNKQKRSIAVDLRGAEGRAIVRALTIAPTAGASVLLTNIACDWLSPTDLLAARPDLITCTIEGNRDGSTAVDYTINCATGFPAMTGLGKGEVVNHALPAWDIACAHHVAFAIAAALVRRAQSGLGAEMRIALSDVAFSTLSHLGSLGEAEIIGNDRPAIGNYLYGAFGRDFLAADGARLYVAAVSLGQWRALIRATGLGDELSELAAAQGRDFEREQDRFDAREEIAALLSTWFVKLSSDDIAIAFDASRVCWGRYRTISEGLRDDTRLSTHNPMFNSIETTGVGTHLAAGPSVREHFRGEERGAGKSFPAPVLGQDTDTILRDVLGLSPGEIARLHKHGIVAGPDSDPLIQKVALRG